MKLVVTGTDPSGVSVIVEDGEPLPVVASGFPALKNTPLWADDTPPAVPHDGSRGGTKQFFPSPGGQRFFLLTIEPEDPGEPGAPPTSDQIVEFEELFPGLIETWEPDEPGMHTSQTIDFGIVLSGSVVLEVDGHVERTLRAGDAFVQNGTRHRWRNPGRTPVVIAVVMVGASRGEDGRR